MGGRVSTIRIGPRSVRLSSLDKLLFPDDGITKGELIDYYRRIAERLVPLLKDRPLTLHRYPRGIHHSGFIQQNVSAYFPDWIQRVTVEKEDGQTTHVVCNDGATLVYLANQNCITLHAWLSRMDRLRHPDRLIFDLDPSGDDFTPVRETALALRTLLEHLHLRAFVMTTGSSGLHVVVPLDRRKDFDDVRQFARDVTEVAAHQHPDTVTIEQRKAKRRDRIYLDTLRNAYGQTAVAPYVVRARPGAPVATPLSWDELSDPELHARRYTIRNLATRLDNRDDPWSNIDRQVRSLEEPRRRLDALRQELNLNPSETSGA